MADVPYFTSLYQAPIAANVNEIQQIPTMYSASQADYTCPKNCVLKVAIDATDDHVETSQGEKTVDTEVNKIKDDLPLTLRFSSINSVYLLSSEMEERGVEKNQTGTLPSEHAIDILTASTSDRVQEDEMASKLSEATEAIKEILNIRTDPPVEIIKIGSMDVKVRSLMKQGNGAPANFL